jgi:hypothetical protein
MNQTGTAHVLQLIDELELALAGFYATVANQQITDPAFWRGLEQEEMRHASYIQQMIAMIETHPDRFHANRTFNPAAIQTFTGYVNDATLRLKSGDAPAWDERYFLALARDMEQSVIEAKFNGIVKTADPEFQALMRRVVAETQTHKSKIVGRLVGRPAN